MFILKNKTFFLSLSVVIILSSLLLVAVFGLKKGIDFTGGAKINALYTDGLPERAALRSAIAAAGLGEPILEPIESGYSVKVKALAEGDREKLKAALTLDGDFVYTESSFTQVGPSIGAELTKKAILAIIAVIIIIVAFIAYSFRTVSLPVPSWKYGLIAISTLAHDIIIPLGLFALLGRYHGAEIDTLFVVALLTILAVSISDTIVVFDRIRENLKLKISSNFEEVVGKSLAQSFVRSVNTSLTVVIVLVALYFFGPEATKNFALVLITGVVVGTYSSIFVASPLLVIAEKLQKKEA